MKLKTIATLALAALMASCGDDEPNMGGTAIQVKMEEDRTVLIGADDGKVYNMKDGAVYATLPGCIQMTDMTMYGENYYATGIVPNQMMVYWMNGEPVNMNASGSTCSIARNGDNVFIFADDGHASIYRNEKRIDQNSEVGIPVDLAAYGTNYYAVGNNVSVPTLWTNQGLTTLDNGGNCAQATSIDLRANSQGVANYISGYLSSTVNGADVTIPCLWRNTILSTLPLNHTDHEKNNHVYRMGKALGVAHYGSDIYVVGSRNDVSDSRATVWIVSDDGEDDVKTYWQGDGSVDAEARRVLVYGSDVYVMTVEHDRVTTNYCTRIWMNHKLKGTVNGIVGKGFVVI